LCAKCPGKIKFLADRAYEDDATRKLIKEKGFDPVIPPKSNRKEPWDKEKYKSAMKQTGYSDESNDFEEYLRVMIKRT
jgi:hypothetical protein